MSAIAALQFPLDSIAQPVDPIRLRDSLGLTVFDGKRRKALDKLPDVQAPKLVLPRHHSFTCDCRPEINVHVLFLHETRIFAIFSRSRPGPHEAIPCTPTLLTLSRRSFTACARMLH